MLAKFSLRGLIVLACLITFANIQTAKADESQLHVRFGLLQGHYTGPENGDFTIPNAFDLEYEIFKANQQSLIFRSIIAMELKTSKPYYTYYGSGYRFYFGSKGMQVEKADENISVSSLPRWKYFAGVDVGISQAIIRSLGKVLQVVSTMVDIGVHGGVSYQIDRRLSVELQLGVTSGQGFSSISVIGYSLRALGGLAYHF